MSAWKLSEAHKWVDKPYTAYERRRELRVRETRQTAIVWDKRYYNSDDGKFESDRIATLNSISLAEMVESEISGCVWIGPSYRTWDEEDKIFARIKDLPKFIPKDNDFEETEQLKETVKVVPPVLKTPETGKTHIWNSDEYQSYVRKREQELVRERRIYLGGDLHGEPICNVRPNNWNPK